MAYTRYNESGHYIFGGNDYVEFTGTVVDDDEADVFIYKLFGCTKDGNEEFWERYYHGSRVIDNFQKGIEVKKHNKHSSGLDQYPPPYQNSPGRSGASIISQSSERRRWNTCWRSFSRRIVFARI